MTNVLIQVSCEKLNTYHNVPITWYNLSPLTVESTSLWASKRDHWKVNVFKTIPYMFYDFDFENCYSVLSFLPLIIFPQLQTMWHFIISHPMPVIRCWFLTWGSTKTSWRGWIYKLYRTPSNIERNAGN